MQPLHDLAIILRSVPYGERHRVLTALTQRHGQISALARNSIQSRRFGGTLEPFAASEWIFTLKPGAELYSLREASIREPFEGLRKSFEKLSLASALNELMLKLAPQNEPCEELFRLHSNALAAINEKEAIPPAASAYGDSEVILLNAYLGKLLQWSGNQPRLQSCLHCGVLLETLDPQVDLSCNVMDAGWICPKCREQGTYYSVPENVFGMKIQISSSQKTFLEPLAPKGLSGSLYLQNHQNKSFHLSSLRVKSIALYDLHLSLYTPIRKVSSLIQASPAAHRQLFKFLEALYVYHIPGFDQKPLKSLRFLGLESTAQHQEVILR